MFESEPTRLCPKCNKEKPLSSFRFKKRFLSRMKNHPYCIDCWLKFNEELYLRAHATD